MTRTFWQPTKLPEEPEEVFKFHNVLHANSDPMSQFADADDDDDMFVKMMQAKLMSAKPQPSGGAPVAAPVSPLNVSSTVKPSENQINVDVTDAYYEDEYENDEDVEFDYMEDELRGERR